MGNELLETVPDPDPDASDRADIDADADVDDDDDFELLPWWQNPINLVAIAVAVALLAGALGLVIGHNRALPDANRVDVGFLQDMRVHHEQAVQLSFIFLNDPGTDADLQTIAREIVVGQDIEIGRMIQLLRDFGESEVNDTDLAMAWMNEPVSADRMPGLASKSDIDSLVAAEGADANRIFVQLMSVHHQGGIHMADYAADHAGTAEVRLMAKQMASSQREEIVEIGNLLTASQTTG
jgi:uncharacterized protein (DUF305 family)